MTRRGLACLAWRSAQQAQPDTRRKPWDFSPINMKTRTLEPICCTIDADWPMEIQPISHIDNTALGGWYGMVESMESCPSTPESLRSPVFIVYIDSSKGKCT